MPATATKPQQGTRKPQRQHSGIRQKRNQLRSVSTPVKSAKLPKRPQSALSRFFSRPFGLEKSFTLIAFLVAISISTLCAFDLAIAWPWMQASRLFDWGFLFCGIMLLGLTFDVVRDQAHIGQTRRRQAMFVERSRDPSDSKLLGDHYHKAA